MQFQWSVTHMGRVSLQPWEIHWHVISKGLWNDMSYHAQRRQMFESGQWLRHILMQWSTIVRKREREREGEKTDISFQEVYEVAWFILYKASPVLCTTWAICITWMICTIRVICITEICCVRDMYHSNNVYLRVRVLMSNKIEPQLSQKLTNVVSDRDSHAHCSFHDIFLNFLQKYCRFSKNYR